MRLSIVGFKPALNSKGLRLVTRDISAVRQGFKPALNSKGLLIRPVAEIMGRAVPFPWLRQAQPGRGMNTNCGDGVLLRKAGQRLRSRGIGAGVHAAKGPAATGRYWSGPLVHSFPTRAEPFNGRRTGPIEACVAQANLSTSSGQADKKVQTSRGRINRLLHRPRLLVDRYGQPVLKKALRPGPYPPAPGRGRSRHHHRPPCVQGRTALRWMQMAATGFAATMPA